MGAQGTSRHHGGSGEPLLLVHGFSATWHTWQPLLPDLERSFEVLAPTLLGHFEGEPFDPGVAPTVGALADGLERELDAAGWDTAHLAGNSLGGWLVLELAKRGRARSVVALSPGGGWRAGSLAAKRVGLLFKVTRAVGQLLPRAERLCASAFGRRLAFGVFAAHPERLEPAAAAHAFRASMECPAYFELLSAITRDQARDLHQVRCPVLIAWPERDRTIPFKRYGRPLREALPSAELRMLRDVGHVPMFDDPAGVATLIRDFAAPAADSAEPTYGAPTTH